jgi:hypothetical protein
MPQDPLLTVADGKPLADRQTDPIPPFPGALAPPRPGVAEVELAPPGPAARQGRVAVPHQPGESQ